jgi:hypothetical protein
MPHSKNVPAEPVAKVGCFCNSSAFLIFDSLSAVALFLQYHITEKIRDNYETLHTQALEESIDFAEESKLNIASELSRPKSRPALMKFLRNFLLPKHIRHSKNLLHYYGQKVPNLSPMNFLTMVEYQAALHIT